MADTKKIQTVGIKVSGIPHVVDEQQLSALFSVYGKNNIHLKNSNPFNHAFVNYESLQDANAAVKNLNGSSFCGNTLSVEIQRPRESGKFTLKISNINPVTSKETLSELFKTTVHPKEVPGKPSFAYANYETKAEMENGLQYHNTTLNGSQIQVKVHKASADQPSETPAVIKSSDTKQFSIKISNINPNSTQERLSELFKTTVCLKKNPDKPSYAYANYDSLRGMNDALQLNNSKIDHYNIQIKEANKSRSLSQSQNTDFNKTTMPMSAALHNFFLKKMIIHIEAFKAKGGTIHWENDILTFTAPDSNAVSHFKDQSIACLDEESIPLSPDQWNLFMSLHPDGSSLFKQLVRPFRSNPNIVIEPVMSTSEVLCVGIKGAVRDAKLTLVPELYKELSVDGAKLFFVLKFLSQVQNEILKKHGVTIQGFQPGSTKLTLAGSGDGIYESYLTLSGIFDRHIVIKGSCVGRLIPSAQKRIGLENLPAVLCAQNESGTICYADYYSSMHCQINILICGAGSIPSRVATILTQPEQRELVLVSIDVLQKLKALPECSFDQLFYSFGVFIQEIAAKPGILIQGYIQTEVNEAFSVLSRAADRFTACSPNLSLVSSVAYSENFSYNCHSKYKSQIQEYITKPLQKRFEVSFLFIDPLPSSKVKSSSSIDSKVSFEILVQSNNAEDFNLACKELKELKPHHKYCSWSKGEYEVITKEIKKEVKTIECTNHVCINFVDKKHAVIIYGLNATGISSTEFCLRNCVQSKLEVESQVQVTRYESLFLRKKHNASLKEFCSVRFPVASDFQNGSGCLVLKGAKAKVELTTQRINEAINNLKVQEMKLRHDSYGEMWKRKWYEVKTQQENTYDVVINVYMVLDKKEASYKTPADMGGTVELTVIGKDGNAVCKVENYIKDIGTTLLRKTETATKEQLKAVLEGFKSKKLRLREDHNTEVVIDKEKLTLEFITPNGSVQELDAACSTVMGYMQGVVIYKETIIVNNSSLLVLLQKKNHWQQIVAIAKHHAVTVKLVRNGVDVRGKSDDIANARISIKGKLQEYLKLMNKRKIAIDNLMAPILSTPIFETVMCNVKQEGVIVSYAKCSTVSSIEMKTSNDLPFAVDVCVGNILTEASDAIVNVTNCNLQHTEGLAKEMINAGGSIIQKESNDYIKSHGALNPCDAICLDSGDLKCGKIIHCVPPRWVDGQHDEAKNAYKTVANCLRCAEECLTGSILIPFFPCGTAEASLKAVLDLCGNGSIKFLHSVRFIVPALEIANNFAKQLQMLQANSTFTSAIASTNSSITDSFDWFWENDSGYFEPYDANTSALLTQQSVISTTYQMVIKGNNYTVNFSKMVQVNDETQKSRCIQRKRLQKKMQAVWKYENDQGQMDHYTQEQSQHIEAMWQSKTPSEMTIGRWRYTFDFVNTPMKQINVTTKRSRHIYRMSCTGETDLDNQAEVILLGSGEGLDKAEIQINKFLQSNMVSEEIDSLSAALPVHVLDTVCKKYKVKRSNSPSGKVVLKGLENNVTKATLEIKDILLQDYNKANIYPDEWEPQNEEPLELKPLTRGSPEWFKVSQQFFATLQSATIVKIERIQNKWLWEKYSQHSERMKRKNEGVVNEKLLFHGTSYTPPSCIYQDEEGFDMRFSNAGFWGNGNYFAVNASYSHNYAHPPSASTRQMFLAKVLTGHSVELNKDSSLRMPPVRCSVKGADMRYDTVTGVTCGSKVFITYSNDKAYPFYLITYNAN